MRETLLLRAESVADDRWYWLRLEADGLPRGGIHAGGLADVAAEAAGLRVVVLASGDECLLTRARVPGRNRQKLLRAVPYALEEQLSDEVENLHFALGEQQADGSWPVAVISRRYLDALSAALAESALDVQQIVPEQLAVPYTADEVSALVIDDLALVRNGAVSGFAADTDNLGVLLAMQYADTDAPRLRLYMQTGMSPPETDEYAAETVIESWSGDPLHLFAAGLDEHTINLLQGDYSRSANWIQLWKPWRATAALLLAGVLVNFTVTGVEYFRLGQESERLHAEIETTFRKALPETKRVVDPRVQMQQQLDSLQHGGAGDNSFLVLLGKAGPILHQVDGIELAALTFRAGRLDLDLKIGNLQLLDQLKQSLAGSAGLDVEIQSATTASDNRVQSRLRIQGKGA